MRNVYNHEQLAYEAEMTFVALQPPSCVITDCKSLYDGLGRSKPFGFGLSEKMTAIEVAAAGGQMRSTDVHEKWVNSDRQFLDAHTKP